jgi:hypothetical protein
MKWLLGLGSGHELEKTNAFQRYRRALADAQEMLSGLVVRCSVAHDPDSSVAVSDNILDLSLLAYEPRSHQHDYPSLCMHMH